MFENIAFLYRDPLFSIAILVAIIVVVVFVDYGRNKYRSKKREMALENFTKSYNETSLDDEIIAFLSYAKNPISSLLFLAKTYNIAGDSAYAIKIYLGLLEQVKNSQEKLIILESLGITYFETGFLQRAKNIFLEILKSQPRNPQILLYLMRTYENMGEYKHALETLDCLNEIGTSKQQKENKLVETYLHFMLLSGDNFLRLEKKNKEIISLMEDSKSIDRLGFGYLYIYARDLFWEEIIKLDSIKSCLDILWQFKQEEIPFEKIQTKKEIMDIFRAKGFVHDEIECDMFELETLRVLQAHSKQKGNITFEYRCVHCKNVFPFDSYRCHTCANVAQMDLVLKIKESKHN